MLESLQERGVSREFVIKSTKWKCDFSAVLKEPTDSRSRMCFIMQVQKYWSLPQKIWVPKTWKIWGDFMQLYFDHKYLWNES